MRVEQLLSRFNGVRRAGAGWVALCSGHEDTHRSLSIGYSEGKILMKCHAGCDTEDVLRAVGLSFKDLMPDAPPGPPAPPGRARIVATYVYTDEGGQPLFRVVRYDNKKFSQQRYTKNGKWANGIAGVRRVPYRMHEIAGAPVETPVFIPEGEKDVDNLVKLGLLATTNQGGAAAWRQIADEARVLLRGRPVVVLPDNDAPGKRHAEDIASSLVGAASSIRILELPGLKPKGDVSDWIAAGGTSDELRRLAAQAPLYTAERAADRFEAELRELFAGTDKGNADLFLAENHEDVRYVHAWSQWLVWDGRYWKPDSDEEVRRRAQGVVSVLLDEAKAAQGAHTRNRLLDWAKRIGSSSRTDGMLAWARADRKILASPKDLDSDPFILNCANGTLDLRTGALRKHRRSDRLTKIIEVPYDENADAPAWREFLARVLPDAELRGFIQRAVGYSLTGDIGEQCIFLLHGSGANGKSTFVETLRDLLGPYAKATESSTFLSRTSDTVRNDLAMLRGARLVTTTETEGQRRLAEALVKQATGGEPIVARHLYSEFFEYRPQFKLWLATNHRPRIRGTDEGVWRRIRLVPFEVTIPKEERDRTMPERLRAELPGILRWAVEGCLAWQREGLGTAGIVEQKTAEYRSQEDELSRWIDICCELRPDCYGRSSTLYANYLEWRKTDDDADGSEPLSKREFGLRLRARGLESIVRGAAKCWRGIVLRAEPARTADLLADSAPQGAFWGREPGEDDDQ